MSKNKHPRINRYREYASCLALALVVSVSTGCHQRYTLFDDGKSDYTIIIAPESSECVHYAAEELQYWLSEVSGVNLSISEDLRAGVRNRRLVVGYNELAKKRIGHVGEPDGEIDSFTYCSKGGDIFLWGNTDRGTLYSVYSFLEKEFGCRWYNSRVSLAPQCTSRFFEKLYNREVPGIMMRNVFYYDVNMHPEFAAKLRSNSTHSSLNDVKFGGSLSYWSCHTLPGFVSAASSFEEHPEYYGLVEGKRSMGAQPCLSNPDVLKITIDATRNAMRRNPGHLIYSVSQGDGMPPCECDGCRAIKARYGGEESGLLLWFVNQVADSVKEEFPDKFIGTFAYQHTRHCPQNIRPRDNVVIRLCSIEECQIHKYDECEQNRLFLTDLEQWPSIANHLYVWDYTTTFSNYLLPTPNVWTFQDRIRRYRDANAIGVMPQGSYQSVSTAFEDMKAYVLAKLLWNPDCDVDAVIRDFADGFFGPSAGPVIREYLAFEKSELIREDNHEDLYLSADADMYSDSFILPARSFFTRAKDAVRASGDDQVYIERIEYAEVAICCLEMFRLPEQGRSDGALELLKRVAEREGITIWQEWGDKTGIEDLLELWGAGLK